MCLLPIMILSKTVLLVRSTTQLTVGFTFLLVRRKIVKKFMLAKVKTLPLAWSSTQAPGDALPRFITPLLNTQEEDIYWNLLML